MALGAEYSRLGLEACFLCIFKIQSWSSISALTLWSRALWIHEKDLSWHLLCGFIFPPQNYHLLWFLVCMGKYSLFVKEYLQNSGWYLQLVNAIFSCQCFFWQHAAAWAPEPTVEHWQLQNNGWLVKRWMIWVKIANSHASYVLYKVFLGKVIVYPQ